MQPYEITRSLQILKGDKTSPKIYIGYNLAGQRVIGSFLEESNEDSVVTYIHSIVGARAYSDFKAGWESLKSIMMGSIATYVVNVGSDGKVLSGRRISLIEIPDELLPGPNSTLASL